MSAMILLINIGIVFYFSLTILILGLLIRVINWYLTKPGSIATVLYPLPQKRRRLRRIVADIFTLPGLFESNPGLWVIVMLFHLSLFGILIGHLHLIETFPGILENLMESSVMKGLGIMLGFIGLISILIFFIRRLTASLREISYLRDYIILLLLFGVFASGDVLRLSSLSIDILREYTRNLLFIQPSIPPVLKGTLSAWLFPAHLLFVSLFLIYLPFSSLIHIFGSFLTNYLRRA